MAYSPTCNCSGTCTCGVQSIVVTVGQGGPRGLQGAQGLQGATGAGTQGVQGPIGPGGGAQGTTGAQGATGTQGTSGTQGATGAQGTEGAQGIQGVDGGGASLQDIADAIASAALQSTDDLTEGTVNRYFTEERVSYPHTQGVASDTWVIIHDLNFYPNVTVQDSAGNIVEGEITYTNKNSLTVSFATSFSGKAYLS